MRCLPTSEASIDLICRVKKQQKVSCELPERDQLYGEKQKSQWTCTQRDVGRKLKRKMCNARK
jgi:hypothetical protein